MNNRDFSNLGEQIRETIEDALNSVDYKNLNQKINETVVMAMDEARRQFRNPGKNMASSAPKAQKVKQGKIKLKWSGRFSGIPMVVLGGLSAFVTLFLTVFSGAFIYDISGVVEKSVGIVMFLFSLALFVLSVVCFVSGGARWNRFLNFRKYVRILDNREFCTVKELSDKTGQPVKKVCEKLRKMIAKGMFPEGFLDEQGTCLIVTREAERLYRDAQESRRQREAMNVQTPKTAVDEMIEKGNHYIRTVREANDAIPGEVISAKLDRLELVIRKIFESVKKHPEQIDEMDKFMEYYLPTTEKLVNAYKEFDALPVRGENVRNSMREIENTLDTISRAFEQLLDDLFLDTAFDISSDISVLQTMLVREGYSEKDFK